MKNKLYLLILLLPYLAIASTVGDRVWLDKNQDWEQNQGEPGLANIQIDLYNANNQKIKSTTTDSNGNYTFENIEDKQYYMEVVVPNGYKAITQKRIAFWENEDLDELDFGLNEIAVPTVNGMVWNDKNEDWEPNNSEKGLENITIELFDEENNKISSTKTDENANFNFKVQNLKDKIHFAEVVVPTGYKLITDKRVEFGGEYVPDLNFGLLKNTTTPPSPNEPITREQLITMIENGEDVTDVNTSEITDMSKLFYNNSTFNQDISNWDVSNVTNMNSMFYHALSFNQNISNWDISNVENHERFANDSALKNEYNPFYEEVVDTTKPIITLIGNKIVNLNIGSTYNDEGAKAIDDVDGDISSNIQVTGLPINTSSEGNYSVTYTVSDSSGNVADMVIRTIIVKHGDSTCDVNTAITREELMQKIGNGEDVTHVNTCKITDMSYLFDGSEWYSPYPATQRETVKNFNQDISGWDTSSVTSMKFMFDRTLAFNQPIDSWDVSNVTDTSYMFHYAEAFNQQLNNWDVSNITNMSSMFKKANKFNKPLNSWDVSNVTNMSYMFDMAQKFNQPLNSWDVSNVTKMYYMFHGAESFNQPLNSWNVSNVTNTSSMFKEAKTFNQPLNSWDVSNVTKMQEMFKWAKAFNQPLNSWNVSNVTKMQEMFYHTENFNQPLNSWDVSNVTDMRNMFSWAITFNQPIDSWDVSSVTNMEFMLHRAFTFNQPLNSWNVSNVTNMKAMFYKAKAFNQPLDNWNVSNVTNMNYMFGETIRFNQPINNWDVSNVKKIISFAPKSALKNEYNPFYKIDTTKPIITLLGNKIVTLNIGYTYTDAGAKAIDDIDGDISSNIQVVGLPMDTSSEGNYSVTYTVSDKAGNIADMVTRTVIVKHGDSTCDGNTAITRESLMQKIGNGEDVTQVNTCKITNMAHLFDAIYKYYPPSQVETVRNFNQDISGWDTGSVTNMSLMFKGTLAFNQPLNNWNVSNVTNIHAMFYEAKKFNQPLNNWDVSNVTKMDSLFYRATSFNQPLNNWDVSNVTSMRIVFSNARAFNQNISNWNVSNVKDMMGMFRYATAFNQDISDWNVSNVMDMSYMFNNALVFNQNISNWDISSVKDHYMFANNSALKNEYNPF